MSPDFAAVDARARGLGPRLFTRAELDALAGHDLGGLVRAIGRSPKLVAPLPDGATPADIERAVRQTALHYVRILSRYDGAAPVLGVFFAEQDRRSLRAMLRGATAAAPGEQRLAGLLPTPILPDAVLAELARQPTVGDVAAHLVVIGHPDAAELSALTVGAEPDLLALDLAVSRGFAARATRAAAAGDDNLRDAVALRIDAANAETALLLATAQDVDPAACFLEGGRDFLRDRFSWVVERRDDVRPRLREALRALPSLVADVALDASRVERAAFSLGLSRQRQAARLTPLSSAPVLLFMMRLDGQARDLRRVVWGAALGAPRGTPWS